MESFLNVLPAIESAIALSSTPYRPPHAPDSPASDVRPGTSDGPDGGAVHSSGGPDCPQHYYNKSVIITFI